jgi:glycerophosphoryl diester phosphodiesterase
MVWTGTACRYYDAVAPRRGFAQIFSHGERLVFAHRGGAKLAPENTVAAFDNGLACGADGIECDVQLSRDGVPVVIHDLTLDRTTNVKGLVSALTAEELARVDAGYHFTCDGGFPFRGQGIGVSPLELLLRRHVTPTIVELKQGDPQLARAVADVVRRTDAVDRVCVGSFHRLAVQTMRSEAPEISTSACEPEARWTLYKSWFRLPGVGHKPYVAFQVPERAGTLRVVSPAFVRRVHAEEATVQVWVVDQAADVTRLFDWGVDGVISDRPDVAVETRNSWMHHDAQ